MIPRPSIPFIQGLAETSVLPYTKLRLKIIIAIFIVGKIGRLNDIR